MHPNHFFIAGAQKCGTTTLYSSLMRHPSVSPAVDPQSGRCLKEVHFFDRFWARGLGWYVAHFPATEQQTFDATPGYLCTPEAAARMAALFPQSKVIVSLRDPVRRAVSQHNHYSQLLPDSQSWDWRRPGESFEANIRAEFSKPFPAWRGLRKRGLYAEQLEHLTRFVPRDRIHVIVMEEWGQSPQAAFEQLLDFLGLESFELPVAVSNRREHTSAQASSETIRQLYEWFRQPNERLFHWLGRDIPSWQPPQTVGWWS